MRVGHRTIRLVQALATSAVLLAASSPTTAAPPSSQQRSHLIDIDRVVVRFDVPELGGPARPRFIFARILSFEARLEALAEPSALPTPSSTPYTDRHVQRALQRHISEEILSSLPISPAPSRDEIQRRAAVAYAILERQAGGRAELLNAAYAEGIEMPEIMQLVRRRAIASLYLDRMISPMLDPSDSELLRVLRTRMTPFRGKPFDQVAHQLRRWYVGVQTKQALSTFFRNNRSRIHIVIIPKER